MFIPLSIDVTTANVHDSKGVYNLLDNIKLYYPQIAVLKSDMGYMGIKPSHNIEIESVKSNYGDSGFIPINGRWVVERTIAWLDNFRRLGHVIMKSISRRHRNTFTRPVLGVFVTVPQSRAYSPLPHHDYKYPQGLAALRLTNIIKPALKTNCKAPD